MSPRCNESQRPQWRPADLSWLSVSPGSDEAKLVAANIRPDTQAVRLQGKSFRIQPARTPEGELRVAVDPLTHLAGLTAVGRLAEATLISECPGLSCGSCAPTPTVLPQRSQLCLMPLRSAFDRSPLVTTHAAQDCAKAHRPVCGRPARMTKGQEVAKRTSHHEARRSCGEPMPHGQPNRRRTPPSRRPLEQTRPRQPDLCPTLSPQCQRRRTVRQRIRDLDFHLRILRTRHPLEHPDQR